jgi:hypothetical protein
MGMLFRRYAILKNQHFAFLDEITKEIPTPREDGVVQSGAPLPQKISPSVSSSSTSYDLNANTSQQRPLTFETVKQELNECSTSSIILANSTENQMNQGKRKRGRPRKEKKER